MDFGFDDKDMDKAIAYFKEEIIQFADPKPVKIINAVPYITTLEYGDVIIYNRRKPNRTTGIFQHPKGGVTRREQYRTIVFQPPKAMVRRSRRVIRNEAIRLCKLNTPRNQNDLRNILLQMADVGLKSIKDLTPVDEDIARQGWLIVP